MSDLHSDARSLTDWTRDQVIARAEGVSSCDCPYCPLGDCPNAYSLITLTPEVTDFLIRGLSRAISDNQQLLALTTRPGSRRLLEARILSYTTTRDALQKGTPIQGLAP